MRAHRTWKIAGSTVAAALLVVIGLVQTPAAAVSGAVQPIAGCTDWSLPANDDGSSSVVTLPFPVNFYGSTYSTAYVNNNGNITFSAPLSAYTPTGLGGVHYPIIAPFFADVDTRGVASNVVQYGASSDNKTFCVNWVDVGYYAWNTDKLNSFQLLLVDRSGDPGGSPGDFDIVFNYDQVEWETGDASGGTDGRGGTSAAVGFSDGSGQFFEMPGSLVPGSFLDLTASGDPNPTGLIYNSLNSLAQSGRYVFAIRAGDVPLGGVTGRVLGGGSALEGSFVQVCQMGGGVCRTSTTNADGRYTVTGLSTGDYAVSAWGPSGSTFMPGALPAPVHVDEAVDPPLTIAPDLTLVGPTPIPAGTTIENSGVNNGIPTVYWGDDLDLATDGCAGGTASYTVTLNGVVIEGGSMTEGPAGHYTAVIPAFYPQHGDAHVSIAIACPGGAVEHIDFSIYIDPSGTVRDQNGDPIAGATVTLYRSDAVGGPFTVVPDGSAIMSPSNRTNPDTTDAVGHFGWDVIAGFYVVHAEASGCHAPGSATTYVETPVLTIPPPVTDLVLTLECATGTDTTPPVVTVGTDPLTLEGDTIGGYASANLTPTVADVTAHDDVDGDLTPTSNATGVLPLGDTPVTWSATDAAGNTGSATQTVTVVDTTAPSITCPVDVNGIVGQTVVLGSATATDIVDASPTIANNAPSSFGPGTTTVHWTASDDSSNTAGCDQRVTLTYRWNGFFSPVSNTTTNKVNAGSTIVFKWSLKDYAHAYVTSLSVVTSRSFSGGSPDASYTLKYDPVARQFVLNAKTPSGWKGSTRIFTLTLNDGTTHTATFKFS